MFKTLSIGEVLWDIFPEYKKPGGSPANLAYHLHCLGTESLLLSRVGKDKNGTELLRFLQDKEINCEFIQRDEHEPTGVVNVTFDKGEPSYTIQKPSAWDFIELNEDLLDLSKSLDSICFASLSQRNSQSRETLQSLLTAVPENCLKVFDLNLRPPFFDPELIISSINNSDVIKINEDESKQLSKWFGKQDFTDEIFKHDPSKMILFTEGSNGSNVFTSEERIHVDAHTISGNGDFVGVGDAFLACFTFLKLKKVNLKKILLLSNQYAAYVASQKGGMPDIPQSLLNTIQ